jgi:hypothetical protein
MKRETPNIASDREISLRATKVLLLLDAYFLKGGGVVPIGRCGKVCARLTY